MSSPPWAPHWQGAASPQVRSTVPLARYEKNRILNRFVLVALLLGSGLTITFSPDVVKKLEGNFEQRLASLHAEKADVFAIEPAAGPLEDVDFSANPTPAPAVSVAEPASEPAVKRPSLYEVAVNTLGRMAVQLTLPSTAAVKENAFAVEPQAGPEEATIEPPVQPAAKPAAVSVSTRVRTTQEAPYYFMPIPVGEPNGIIPASSELEVLERRGERLRVRYNANMVWITATRTEMLSQ